MDFTKKQAECLLDCDYRWNIYSGATRAGKTFFTYWLLLKRIKDLPKGRCVLIGKTLSTLSFNVLDPMRDIFGLTCISDIKTRADGIKICYIFGREFRVVGANDKRSTTKIQGSGLIYAYGDEVGTWDESFFAMLKSRLDSKHAKFDGTTNPDAPNHWLKKFIDDGIRKNLSLNAVHFKIDDNTTLDPEFIENLKKEYEGTVYYDRYILGRWVAAEGSIYNVFIKQKEKYIIKKIPEGSRGFISIGVDFGGNKSGHAFNATLIDFTNFRVITFKDYWKNDKMDPTTLDAEFIKFVRKVRDQYPMFNITDIRADSANQVLIAGFNSALVKEGLGYKVQNAIKGEINERIQFYISLFGLMAYYILEECTNTIEAFEGAVWKEMLGQKDERLDDGTSNIDTLDAQEYSTEPHMKNLLKVIRYGKKAKK